MTLIRQALAVCAKDLRSELRTKESINASASFAVVILLLFSFALDLTPDQSRDLSGGLLWMVFAFAGALILNRSFSRELPNDCLDVLVSAPISGSALFLGKALANWSLLMAVELFCMPLFGIFYDVNWAREPLWLLLVLALATWAMTVIGTMFSALTVNLQLRELMLPTLVYPMMVPALMSAMKLTSVLIAGVALTPDVMLWLRLLIAFDVIFTALSLALIDTVLVG